MLLYAALSRPGQELLMALLAVVLLLIGPEMSPIWERNMRSSLWKPSPRLCPGRRKR